MVLCYKKVPYYSWEEFDKDKNPFSIPYFDALKEFSIDWTNSFYWDMISIAKIHENKYPSVNVYRADIQRWKEIQLPDELKYNSGFYGMFYSLHELMYFITTHKLNEIDILKNLKEELNATEKGKYTATITYNHPIDNDLYVMHVLKVIKTFSFYTQEHYYKFAFHIFTISTKTPSELLENNWSSFMRNTLGPSFKNKEEV